MDNCLHSHTCLICRRVTQESSPINSEKLVLNASLLQDFLHCFHINALDSEVTDLSTSCHFCLTCEQFLSERSSIQAQMTQLKRRAAQLKSTLSVLLLSAPQTDEPNHHKDVTQIIQNRVQLPLLLQHTTDDIRNELRKKYSVHVMLEKIPLTPAVQAPSPLSADCDSNGDHWEFGAEGCNAMSDKILLPPALKLDPLELDPLPNDNDNNTDDNWDHWQGDASTPVPVVPKMEPLSSVDDSNDDELWDHFGFEDHASHEDYLPSGDELDDEETCEQILGLTMETEGEANCDDYSNLWDSVDSQGMRVTAGTSKIKGCPRKNLYDPAVIRDGPNKFKYNGYDITFNNEDKCYYCGVCNFRGYAVIQSILAHIRLRHYTAEDKSKFLAVKISNTEWLYGGEYKIIQEDNKFKCLTCGSVRNSLHTQVFHIRSQHVRLEGPDEVPPERLQPLLGGNNDGNKDEPWECMAQDSDEEYMPNEDPLNDEDTSEQIFGVRIKTEQGSNCDESNLQEDCTETQAKAGSSKTNGRPKRQPGLCKSNTGQRDYQLVVVPDGPSRFKYNGYGVRLNDEDQCYYCDVCHFNGRSRLCTVLAHIRAKHYTAEDKVKFSAVQISDNEWLYGGKYKIIREDEKKFKCVSCGYVQSRLLYLVAHIRTQHVNLEAPEEVLPLPATAPPSVNDFTAIQGEFESVPYSFNAADNKYTCGQCETQVSTWNSLSRHIQQSHTAQKFPCEICGKELSSKQTHQRHVKLHETGPMKCPTCAKEFLGEQNFKKHMELHELGEEAKKYQCEFCGKKMLFQKSYKNHRRLHTGEKPYECKICGQRFPGTGHLTRHRTTVHGIQPRSRIVMKVSK